MSGEKRVGLRRPRTIVLGAAALAVVALGAGVAFSANQPHRVPDSEIHMTPHPTAVAANSPVQPAPKTANLTDAAAVMDITASTTDSFSGDVSDVRGRVQKTKAVEAIVKTDACLTDWAKKNLAKLAENGAYEVVTACGRPTAVLAGPIMADDKVLVYGALEKTAPAGMKALLAESKSNRIAFAAVSSGDGQASLLAASVLPNVKEPKIVSNQNPDPDKAPDGKDIIYTK